jgi:hypothetical protein
MTSSPTGRESGSGGARGDRLMMVTQKYPMPTVSLHLNNFRRAPCRKILNMNSRLKNIRR